MSSSNQSYLHIMQRRLEIPLLRTTDAHIACQGVIFLVAIQVKLSLARNAVNIHVWIRPCEYPPISLKKLTSYGDAFALRETDVMDTTWIYWTMITHLAILTLCADALYADDLSAIGTDD